MDITRCIQLAHLILKTLLNHSMYMSSVNSFLSHFNFTMLNISARNTLWKCHTLSPKKFITTSFSFFLFHIFKKLNYISEGLSSLTPFPFVESEISPCAFAAMENVFVLFHTAFILQNPFSIIFVRSSASQCQSLMKPSSSISMIM